MSLDYYLADVENHKELCLQEAEAEGCVELKRITHNIIWATMATGINKLTKKNTFVFWTRYKFWQAVKGFELGFTYEDLIAHIGLRTNASNDPSSRWLKSVWDSYERDANWQYRQQMAAHEKQVLKGYSVNG